MNTSLQLGVIGTGSVVREIYQHLYFASEYAPLLSIEAAADPNAQALADFCDRWNIPPDRRFTDYQAMIEQVELDAVQCNTPDSLHEAPTLFALEHGLDVLLPKPLADSITAAHRMIDAARRNGRLLGVDFHKRDDPRVREAAARYQAGEYGRFQLAVLHMLDKLEVSDPNHEPRFFASPDFAEKNSPITFLTVHMADLLMRIVEDRPVEVRAQAWSQKMPTLRPRPVHGYDLCDTEIRFEQGGVGHVITGWHLPNSAPALSVQRTRLICTDGMIDLSNSDYEQMTPAGIEHPNPLFLNFEHDGRVTGFGVSRPGRLYQRFLEHRRGELADEQREQLMSPGELGFWTSAVLEAAGESLEQSRRTEHGATHGVAVDLPELIRRRLGDAAEPYLAR